MTFREQGSSRDDDPAQLSVSHDRRDGQRHISILRVAKMVSGASEDLCLVRNISAGGLMAHVYVALEVGERVSFELKTDRRLGGTVRWVRDSNVGIQFDEPIDVADFLSEQSTADAGVKPRAPRLQRTCKATVRRGADTLRVDVRDVSQGGAKIAYHGELSRGDDVVVRLAGFRPLAATVRWTGDGLAGIAFNQIIPYPEFTAWLQGGD